MQLNLDVEKDVNVLLEKAVLRVLDTMEVPVPPVIETESEPDWSSTDAIEAYIRSLRGDIDIVNKAQTEVRSHKAPVDDVQQAVRQIMEQALIAINKRRVEVQHAINKTDEIGFEVANKLRKANERLADLQKLRENLEKLAVLEGTVKSLCEDFESWHKARPYQVDGILAAVAAYTNGKSGFLDADDMGLGKTFKATILMFILRALHMNKYGHEPFILWVTKKSLIKSNLREIKKWYPEHKIVPNLGTTPDSRKQFFDFSMMTHAMQICSYENVRDTPEIQAFKWDFVFADEVHRLKGGANPKPTQIWEVMRQVCRHAKFMYFLSGTPIVNRPEEMWSYLHIFAPERFPKVKNFLAEFTTADYKSGQLIMSVDVDRLMNRALAGQMIHRTKLEVGMQLPDKERVFYYLDLEGKQLQYYEQMRDNFFVWLGNQEEKKQMSASVLIAQLNRLRQLALHPAGMKYIDGDGREWRFDADTESAKLDQAVDLVEEINEQVVISSAQFNEPLVELARRLRLAGKSVAVIDSSTSHKVDEFEHDFQQGKIDCLLVNMQTGSEGLNLHKSPEFWPGGASHMIMLDLWWNPAKNVQMEDRIWRDGCKEPVTIHILQAESTVDAYVASIVQEKEETISPIMNDSRLRPAAEWRELLQGKI